jgi:hypothetical protein
MEDKSILASLDPNLVLSIRIFFDRDGKVHSYHEMN